MNYNPPELNAFIKDRLGSKAVLFAPKIDRLVSLYLEYASIRDWLADNQDLVGTKQYKEMVTCLNAMMQNIRNLEEDIGLFSEKNNDLSSNELLNNFKELM